jgi:DUF3040 family protein
MFPDLPSDRRLTDAERAQLAELERRLTADDPGLVRRFRGGPLTRPFERRGRATAEPIPRAALAVFAAVAAGLVLAAAVIGGVGGGVAVGMALVLTTLAVVVPRRNRPRPARPAAPAFRKPAKP